MNTYEPTPASPAGQEPLADLFSDIFRLANQVSSRISQDDVEARLRRVLRRSGHGPAGAESAPLIQAHFEMPRAIAALVAGAELPIAPPVHPGPEPLEPSGFTAAQEQVIVAAAKRLGRRAAEGGRGTEAVPDFLRRAVRSGAEASGVTAREGDHRSA
jgi:hypothetical protein